MRLLSVFGISLWLFTVGGRDNLYGGTYAPVPGSGTVDLAIFSLGGFDIAGGAAFVDPALPGNPVIIFDPGTLIHPLNTLLLGANSGLSELVTVVFNPAGAGTNGTSLFLPGLVTPVAPLSDPGLLGLVGLRSFAFSLAGQSADVGVYNLVSITSGVPEPVDCSLVATGLAVLIILRRRGRRSLDLT